MNLLRGRKTCSSNDELKFTVQNPLVGQKIAAFIEKGSQNDKQKSLPDGGKHVSWSKSMFVAAKRLSGRSWASSRASESEVGALENAVQLAPISSTSQLAMPRPSHSRMESFPEGLEDTELRASHVRMESFPEDAESLDNAVQSKKDGTTELRLERKSIAEKDFVKSKHHRPYVCAAYLFVCVVMMLVEISHNNWALEPFSVNPMLGPKPQVLIGLGAKDTELILNGEIYRFITPMVLHAGILHTAFNMFGLYQLGFLLERDFGHTKTAAILVSSGFVRALLWILRDLFINPGE